MLSINVMVIACSRLAFARRFHGSVKESVESAVLTLFHGNSIFLGEAIWRQPRESTLDSCKERAMRRTAISQMGAMQRRTRIASCLIGLVLSYAAVASSTGARIERILIFEGGNLVYVYPVGGIVNPPACHGSNGNYYSFSLNRPRAREYLAGLLAAQAQGASVGFYGTGTCIDQSVSETLSYFSITS